MKRILTIVALWVVRYRLYLAHESLSRIASDGSISDTTINWGGNSENDDPNRDTEVTTEGATGTTRSM